MENLERHFEKYRKNIVGINSKFESPYGIKSLVYCDWTATGRLYSTIEEKMVNQFGKMNGNTHSLSSKVGEFMSCAYAESKNVIKEAVSAGNNDIVLTGGGGMSWAIYKLISILNLEAYNNPKRRATIFISHLEHNSNYLPWISSRCKVIVVPPNKKGEVCPKRFEREIQKYKNCGVKIVSITACSNVTGCKTNYMEIAEIIHRYNGYCVVDFAAIAAYDKIYMNINGKRKLDAILFSGHKFLGGPGSSGVLVFDKRLYKKDRPTNPAGGTVEWVSTSGKTIYYRDIDKREEAGTPQYLQSIKVALAMKLKEKMQLEKIKKREEEILNKSMNLLEHCEGIDILETSRENRIPIISFIPSRIHYNLFVKQISDRFGVQSRGGCSCAGLLGEKIFNLKGRKSEMIYKDILRGNRQSKPGWVRLSFHPTTTNDEIEYVCMAVKDIARMGEKYAKDYIYLKNDNEFANIFEKKDNYKTMFNI